MAKNIAIIIGSVRKTRKAHQVAEWVHEQLTPLAEKQGATLELVDLAKYGLPLHDGNPAILMKLKEKGEDGEGHEYPDDKVNAWSQTIRSHDGYVFVTPEYNGSFPSPLKAGLDHIYHEFGGKPALVVSYGGPGRGVSSGQQLVTVLKRLKLNVAEQQVNLEAAARTNPNAPVDNEIRASWSVQDVVTAWESFNKL
ncbi:NADPH-dependent FMN reductase [Acaromyces ingoldii]|uniref:NADPH-dependent FMN reductase n=1 Tax=Acaromyces ingoldii TaxID=215250 RepID=A0A316YC17_9BASI|nr:NADPH-dependent FMN reductase [Acaromyces ingoldii]PWN86771.1 NADPH-dependent FMN reductase [Acaromyces ingoldii]